MLYIWEENTEFFDNLPNKSKLINLFLQEKRKNRPEAITSDQEFKALVEEFDARVKPKRKTTATAD